MIHETDSFVLSGLLIFSRFDIFHDVNSKEPCTQVSKEFLKLKKMQSLRFNFFMLISGSVSLMSAVALFFWCVIIAAGKSSSLIEWVGGTKILLIQI